MIFAENRASSSFHVPWVHIDFTQFASIDPLSFNIGLHLFLLFDEKVRLSCAIFVLGSLGPARGSIFLRNVTGFYEKLFISI